MDGPQGREEVLPAGVQGQPLPGAEEPVQVRRLLHEPPRPEGAPALDRRTARDMCISIEVEQFRNMLHGIHTVWALWDTGYFIIFLYQVTLYTWIDFNINKR